MSATDVKITVRLPAELHAAIAKIAETERRSLNGQIVKLLEEATRQNKKRG